MRRAVSEVARPRTSPFETSLSSRLGAGALLLLLFLLSLSFPQSPYAQENADRAEVYAEALRYTFQWLQKRDELPGVRQFKFDPTPRGRDQMSPAVATIVTERLALSSGEYEITCPDDRGEKFEEGCRLPDDEEGFISAELESLQADTATVSTQIYYASQPGGRLAVLVLTLELERSTSGDGWVVRELLSTERGSS